MASTRNALRREYADTRLGQIHYARAGHSENTLLMLPQSARSWRMFAELAERLSDVFTIFAVDYPGSGGSDALEKDTTFEDIAGAFFDLLDEEGREKTCIYGIHTGNKIGTAMAAQNPARVERIVLAGQSHSLVASKSIRVGTVGKTRRKLIDTDDERQVALLLWADVFNNFSGMWWAEDLMKALGDASARRRVIGRAIDELQAAQDIANLYRANFRYDLERDFRQIKAPTLIIEIATPAEDRLIGRQGPTVVSLIPGSRLVTLEAPDFHGITLENRTDELAPILRDFLVR